MKFRHTLRCVATALAAAGLAFGGSAGHAQRMYPTYSLPDALPAPDGVPITVYRGLMAGDRPSWVELADLGKGQFVLTLLDGMPGVQDSPASFRLASNGRSGRNCALANGSAIRIDGCPAGKAQAVKINLNGNKGTVTLVPIGIVAAYGYSGPGGSPGDDNRTMAERIAGRCILSALSSTAQAEGSTTAQPLAALRASLAAAQSPAGTGTRLADLRRARKGAYDALTYTAWEIERLNSLQLPSDRLLDFRMAARLTEQRMRYVQQIDNTPQRIQARNDLAQIEAGLARIYNPAAVAARAATLSAVTDTGLLLQVDSALAGLLRTDTEFAEDELFALENGLEQMADCAAAMAGDSGARPALSAQIALDERFGMLALAMDSNFVALASNGARSDELDRKLRRYQESPAIRRALANAGNERWLEDAQGLIAIVADGERREAEKQAKIAAAQRAQAAFNAQQAELARLAISRNGANAPTDGDILDAYTRYMWVNTVNAPGNIGVRPVPGTRFQLRATGRMGGELFRVRFDVRDKQCSRLATGRYRCSFAIINQFSNARDGSIESWVNGLSDDIFSAIGGRNNEGLTGRIQSNSVNRLLLNESSTFTTTFVFSKGQFDSEDLHEAVWGNTMWTL